MEWPELGDKGTYANDIKMGDWAIGKKAAWENVCDKYGGNKEAFDWGTWGFFDWAIGKAWPTLSSISKARRFGWSRHDDTFETWVETFRTFENAGILPRNSVLHKKTSPVQAVNGAVNGGVNGAINGKREVSETGGDLQVEVPSPVTA